MIRGGKVPSHEIKGISPRLPECLKYWYGSSRVHGPNRMSMSSKPKKFVFLLDSNFFAGLSDCIDVWGRASTALHRKAVWANDSIALWSDWSIVGQDIRTACRAVDWWTFKPTPQLSLFETEGVHERRTEAEDSNARVSRDR